MHPVLFRLGPLTVTSFFVFSAAAFGVAAFLAARRALQAGLLPGQIRVLGAAALFSMVLGSRLGYLAIHWTYYRRHPEEILRIDSGGLAMAGGLLITCVVVPILLRRYRKPVLSTVDRMIPPLALGQAIVRIGCFLEGCCYGRLTHLPWGLAYPLETARRHPTQLYEAFLLFSLYRFLLRMERRPRWAQTNLLWYLCVYGLFRAGADFLRVDPGPDLWGLKLSQWLALPLGLLGAFGLIRRCTRSS